MDDDKPVAFRYEHRAELDDFGTVPLLPDDKKAGWTETPLYTRSDSDTIAALLLPSWGVCDGR